MKILHVNSEFTWRGGERQLILLATAQCDAGHDPIIVCQPGSASEAAAIERGLRVFPLRMRGEWDIVASGQLRRLIDTMNPDVLHLHTSHSHALGLLATFARPLPTVVHRRVDFPLKNTIFSRLKYGRRVHRYVAVSQNVAKVLHRGGVDSDRIVVVYSGTPAPVVAAEDERAGKIAELGLDARIPLLASVAHLVDHKGHRYLIDAMPQIVARYPHALLLLVGDGPLREKLEEQVARLKLTANVRFLGFRKDIELILQIIHIYIAASHLEGLNTSLMDAMWSKCPVVATEAGGIPEVVGMDVGWLVPPRDPAALAAAVLEVVSQPLEAARRAARGRERVENCFSVEMMVEKIESAYWEAIHESRRWSLPGRPA